MKRKKVEELISSESDYLWGLLLQPGLPPTGELGSQLKPTAASSTELTQPMPLSFVSEAVLVLAQTKFRLDD